jgi:RNA polymerase sigma-70 factor (ECF subfamily)
MARYEPRLLRMLALRLDRRLHSRIDPADVLQETYLQARTYLADYVQQPKMSFYFWLPGIANHKLH